ncbi:MAG: MAPEG family protein [Steroidobacteraceae bacterium]
MSLLMVLLPLFVEVVLTFVLLFSVPIRSVPLLRRGEVRAQDVDLRQPNWPRPVQQINNSYTSQFELPVLFYVLTILAYVTHHAGVLFVVLAWIFVLARLAHAYIHVTSNNIDQRGPVFGVGALVLAIMWLIYIIDILLGI